MLVYFIIVDEEHLISFGLCKVRLSSGEEEQFQSGPLKDTSLWAVSFA